MAATARAVTEAVVVTDPLASALMSVREVTEGVGLTDAAVGLILGGINIQVTITEAIGVTDSITTRGGGWWAKSPVGATKSPVGRSTMVIGRDKRTSDEESPG
jgi:hypothetical protein